MRVSLWLARYPWWSVLFVSLVSLLAVQVLFKGGQLQLKIDPSVERLLPQKDQDRAVYERLTQQFGHSEPVLLALNLPVDTLAVLPALHQLTEAIRALPDVASAVSVADVPDLRLEDDTLSTGTLLEAAQAADWPTRWPQVRQDLQQPLFQGLTRAEDPRWTLILITLKQADEATYRQHGLDARLRALAHSQFPTAKVALTGNIAVKVATSEALQRTLRFTLPAVFALITVVLCVAFRAWKPVLAGLLTVATALLWTLAACSWLQWPIHLLTAIAPPLILTQGFCYAIHALNEFQGVGKEDVAGYAARGRHALPPLLMTAATTIVGFLALMVNPLPAVVQFAALSALGIALSAVLVFLFLPALMRLARDVSQPPIERVTALAQWLANLAVKKRTFLMILAALIVAWGAGSSLSLKASGQFIEGFPSQSSVRQDFEAVNQALGGANFVNVLIETPDKGLLMHKAAQIDALQRWLRQQPEVGGVYSYVDWLHLLHEKLAGAARGAPLPADPAALHQLLLFGGDEALASLADPDLQTARLVLRLKIDNAEAVQALVQRIEARPYPFALHLTGTPILAAKAINDLTQGQWQSLALALGLIFVLLTFVLMSWQAALLALVPNLVPMAFYFGLLSVTGIGINPTTSLIASIVLGISVDDTIHFMTRFNDEARKTGAEAVAVSRALAGVLRPITITAVALCLGFLAFTGAELKNQQQFGWLAAATLGFGWLSEITLMPALCSCMRIVTFWDVLRLDLGQSPQHTIPLLAGLSDRQARTFALSAKLETWPPDTRLITEGEFSRDIFVVIDGSLTAWVCRDNTRKVFNTMSRGAVIGEAGYFGQRRTANVDVVQSVRVLRFNSQDLESLRAYHPRIAATVFRNLNAIQAERIARMTAMVK